MTEPVKEPSAKDYIDRLDRDLSVASVNKVFDEIEALPAASRAKILDDVETFTVTEFRKTLNPRELAQARMIIQLLEDAKDTPQGKMILAHLESQAGNLGEEAQALSQIVLRLHQAKGDQSDTVIKTYVAEAAKLSDDEFASPLGQLKLVLNVDAKLAEENKPPKPQNPFRKGPANGGLTP